MKKIVFLAVLMVFMSNVVYAEMIMPAQSIENEVVEVEKPNQAYTMLNQIRKDRNTIYNVLNLTPTQICKTREIEKERFEEITPLVDQLMLRKKEMRQLKYQEASNRELNAVQRDLDRISRSIKKVCAKYDKRFEKLLTDEQKNKYNMVQKLRFEDLKKFKKVQKNGAKQSDLRPFGVAISQPAYLEELKEQRSLKNKCKNLFKRK